MLRMLSFLLDVSFLSVQFERTESIGKIMEDPTIWTVVHSASDRVDLEVKTESGVKRKEVRRPPHMNPTEWLHQFPPGSKLGENTLRYILKEP